MRVGVVHATTDNKTYNAIVYVDVDIVSVDVTSDSVHGSNVRSVTNGKQMVTTPTVWWTSVQ